jgi:hypothetical protein
MCRLLNHMQAKQLDICVPVRGEPAADARPAIDLSSGYIQRAAAVLPRQTDRAPWHMNQDYLQDLVALRWSRLEDGALRFRRRVAVRTDSVTA